MFAPKRRLSEALVSCERRLAPGLRPGLEMTAPLRGSFSSAPLYHAATGRRIGIRLSILYFVFCIFNLFFVPLRDKL